MVEIVTPADFHPAPSERVRIAGYDLVSRRALIEILRIERGTDRLLPTGRLYWISPPRLLCAGGFAAINAAVFAAPRTSQTEEAFAARSRRRRPAAPGALRLPYRDD